MYYLSFFTEDQKPTEIKLASEEDSLADSWKDFCAFYDNEFHRLVSAAQCVLLVSGNCTINILCFSKCYQWMH